ncbi:MAG: TIGR03013 family XrtA/PEP-CTERM system glycosyltransferase [Alcanivoracaceae bacterium]
MTTVRIFRHHIDSSFLRLTLIEFLLLFAAVILAALLRYQGDLQAISESIGLLWPRALLFAAVHWLGFLALGLYLPNLRDGFTGVVIRLVVSLVAGTVALALLYYLIPTAFLGRGVLALATLISLILVLVCRALFYRIVGTDRLRTRVLVLGAGEQANSILQRMRRRADQRNFRLMGFYPLPGEPLRVDPPLLLAGNIPLCDLVRALDIDEVVVAASNRRGNVPVDDLLQCRLEGVKIVDVQTFFERESCMILVDLLLPSHLIFSDGFVRNIINDRLHRGMDIVFSSLLLLVTWPVMLLTVLAIKLEDGRKAPVFYFQERIGALGRPYNVIKFRSMIENAERNGAQWAQQNDMRVTRIGAFIRKYRIDELPQIFNVLRGEMGFVGPRPERPVFVEELKGKIPFYNERHLVKPGITGWAQLNYAYGASEKDSQEKLQYDLYYIKNRSVLLDLIILVQTVEVVLFGRGR